MIHAVQPPDDRGHQLLRPSPPLSVEMLTEERRRRLAFDLLGLLGMPSMFTRSLVLGILLSAAGCGHRATAVGDAAAPNVDGAASNADGGLARDVPTSCCGSWDCTGGGVGDRCQTRFDPLPPGPGPWRCHQHEGGWHCDGKVPVGGIPIPPPPPNAKPWSCERITVVGSSPDGSLPAPGYDAIVRCSRPIAATDTPPTVKHAACVMGSAFGGLRCTISAGPPAPPTPWVAPDERCTPGQKRWCDDILYSGWGQATCLPSGRWPTKTVNGKQLLDCQGSADGRRPDTLCACYSFFVNPRCCERVDCLVATRDDGSESSQVCPKSEGKACDYCNPQKPECQAADAQCLVTNANETFCAEPCGPGESCPQGYACTAIKNKPRSYCVPSDFSCYL